jgi:hypothetical protein
MFRSAAFESAEQSNVFPLHFGHGAATSAGTGRVKCFVYPQEIHLQASALCSSALAFSIFFRTESAWFRIDFSTRIIALCAPSIDRVPAVEVYRLPFAVVASTKIAGIASCSHEHITIFEVLSTSNDRAFSTDSGASDFVSDVDPVTRRPARSTVFSLQTRC